MRRSLTGKRVLITGASSGIGVAAARLFAEAGAHVALVARSREGLERAAQEARAFGVQAHVVVADLAERAGCEAAVEEGAAALGGIDVLVWNAASMVFGDFRQVSPELFDRTMDSTFRAAVDTIRAALPHLDRAERGAILATGSLMATVPLPTFASYAAAKHALRGFLNTLRVELLAEKSRISVTMVHPGAVDTPLWQNVTSVTGRQPRTPPDQYAATEIARALVACAEKPRREFTVGGEGRAVELLFYYVPAVADRVLVLVSKWYHSGRRPAPVPGMLLQGMGAGGSDGGLHGRPSLWARLRLRRR